MWKIDLRRLMFIYNTPYFVFFILLRVIKFIRSLDTSGGNHSIEN